MEIFLTIFTAACWWVGGFLTGRAYEKKYSPLMGPMKEALTGWIACQAKYLEQLEENQKLKSKLPVESPIQML